MLEHITRGLYYFEVHLLFASIVGLVAWILTSIPEGSASTKYWIWVAATLNFFLPVGAVLDKTFASRLSSATPLGVIGDAANRLSHSSAATLLLMMWLLGAVLMFMRLCYRVSVGGRDGEAVANQNAFEAKRTFAADGVPVRFGDSRHAPAVRGFLRPHISLPQGIDLLLNKQELNAVLIHEVTHARRRDNLIRLIYEVGLCALWFHPLVWISGSRLSLYRELSCDEAVIESARGGDLVSALAKLAEPEESFMLQASASSFLINRLAKLTAGEPQVKSRTGSGLLIAFFGTMLLMSIAGTVLHTACCFINK